MKKKVIIAVLCVVLTISCVSMLFACGEAKTKIKMVGIDLSSEEYAFAIKKGDTELLNTVNKFFDDKDADIKAIFAKYTAEGVDLNDATKFGSDSIKTTPSNSDKELVVATNLEFAPFEYTIGSKIAGIDMEIAQMLADYMGKELVVVHMDFDAVVTSVETKPEYDIGIAGLTVTPERQESVQFSKTYFGATQVLITKEGDTTFDDCKNAKEVEAKLKTLSGDAAKCGGQTGTTSQFYVKGSEDFGFEGFSNLSFGNYSSAAEAVNDMINGNIAFVVVDKTTAQALVASFNG